jgi:hypothetical protein
MYIEAPLLRDVDEREPIAWLRAYTEGVEPRVLPLFRRPSRVTVGSGKGCDWRFEAAELAELELVLAWDGVRLRAQDATQPDGPATVRHGQSIIAGATGRLRIALDLVLHDDEITMVRWVEAPSPLPSPSPSPSDETTAPMPLQPPTAITPAPADITATHPWRVYLPPRNGAADGEPTREWPLDDALRPTADLLDRIGKRGLRTLARRAPPRRLALYGALALVFAVEAFMILRPRHAAPPPTVQTAPTATRSATADRRARVFLPDKDVELTLHRAIAAYRAGKTAEALADFARVAEDTNDSAARTMLFVLRSRGASTP